VPTRATQSPERATEINAEMTKDVAERSREMAFRAALCGVLARAGTIQSVLQVCTQAMMRHLDVACALIWTTLGPRPALSLPGIGAQEDRCRLGGFLEPQHSPLDVRQREAFRTRLATRTPRLLPRGGKSPWHRTLGLIPSRATR
jgi:hypothetical protein